MKRLLFCLLILTSFVGKAQVYNNEWIDHTKTYYKFKVGRNGLFRIPQSTLSAAGLGNTPAEFFQLWRNGQQIPIYTSIANGIFSGNDYIEFWGEMNDGKADKELYRNPDFQLNDKWSLSTDTSTYFLTVHADAQSNLRLTATANNVSSNTLPAESYFMHTEGRYFRDRLNRGAAVYVGELLYSAAYDRGEGWTSPNIGANGTNNFTFNNLFVFPGGPNPKFKIHVSGNSYANTRRYRVEINGDSVLGKQVDYYNYSKDSTQIPLNLLASNTAAVTVRNIAEGGNMVIHQYELTYPRRFNFGGSSNFEFKLPASSQGNYLEITGFNYGSSAPVLYDLTNGMRYVADISSASVIRIALQPSAGERRLVLVSQEGSNVNTVNALTTRNFVNYRNAISQGNFLIITNSLLIPNSGHDPIEEYRLYRSSVEGGSHIAKIYLVDELVDQFAFGIKKHPASIRNFLLFAHSQFSVAPKHVFLIGKGLNYVEQKNNESNPEVDLLNLVPAFGFPASDVMLAAEKGSSYPLIPVGRLSVINKEEVALYLKKVKEFELAQRTPSPFIKDKAWMKNVMHTVGSSEPGLQAILDNYMTDYKRIISDTLFGGKVHTFTKTSAESVQQLNSGQVDRLFEEGLSVITYFGHSSAAALEFNLNSPEQYNNQGKYPLFIGLGCNAGNFYTFNSGRFISRETLSEKYVLAQDKGTIGFIASSHFGIVHYLDIYNTRLYKAMTKTVYGGSIGQMMQATIADMFAYTSQEDFYSRSQCEETSLHGDPAIVINPHLQPDYAIEDQLARVIPGFVSVADKTFRVSAKFMNLGRAIGKDVKVRINRTYPDGTTGVIYEQYLPGIRYADSISIDVPIDAVKDKGNNKLTITIDPDNEIDELFETNNSVSKEFVIYDDEARPVYPYNLSIVREQNIKFLASTANPFSTLKSYQFQIDTTELFNTPLASQTVSSKGGVLEFNAGINFKENTVYYWRVGVVNTSGNLQWNAASFTYIPGSELGYNQAHLHQHFKSNLHQIKLDSTSRRWSYGTVNNSLFLRVATFTDGALQESDITVAVNGDPYIRSTCWFSSLVFNVFDPNSFKPWENTTLQGASSEYPTGLGLYGSSSNNCQVGTKYNFEFRYTSPEDRKKIMDFMRDVIPDGAYVAVRNFTLNPARYPGFPVAWADEWAADTSLYGSGQSLYHYIKQAGLHSIDLFYETRPWGLVYKKGDPSFEPQSIMANKMTDRLSLPVTCPSPATSGVVLSPILGPAKSWKSFVWDGSSIESDGDQSQVSIIGMMKNGYVDTLFRNITPADNNIDLSSIDAVKYPYLQLYMKDQDEVHATPYQLKYWRVLYEPVAEGAVSPNVFFEMKDTVEVGEPISFKMAFKNISPYKFNDSLKIRMVVVDNNNVTHEIPVLKHRPLNAGDTIHVRHPLDTRKFAGFNTLFVDVNPDNDQPEQYRFNNFIYKNFFARGDSLNPLLDVTFDNNRILNGDIVASKPNIVIKLKDEAKWMYLDDTSMVKVKVRYPNNEIHYYTYSSDTLRFTPAQNIPGSNNTATVYFNPYFKEDGDYELIVEGHDKSANKAGAVEYRVGFKVVNKPMISNMLNYPNPFTTSTAFVFTITGSEVPQNIKIQILTITGKIVREITKQELGPLRVGRNITEFKWDGTDQYGQKLANGVYLYRVITNHNGKSLDKYKAKDDNTDQYFNKGYGKMYLMR